MMVALRFIVNYVARFFHARHGSSCCLAIFSEVSMLMSVLRKGVVIYG